MASHRFALGQSVKLRSWTGYLLTDAETYRITAFLPASDNSPQYRIRSDAERHDRVVTEDSLEAAEPPVDLGARSSA